MVPLSVSHCSPAEKCRDRSVLLKRQHHLPTISHPLPRDQINPVLLKAFTNYAFKRFEVNLFEENDKETETNPIEFLNCFGPARARHTEAAAAYSIANSPL